MKIYPLLVGKTEDDLKEGIMVRVAADKGKRVVLGDKEPLYCMDIPVEQVKDIVEIDDPEPPEPEE